jgi:hypothetical protein
MDHQEITEDTPQTRTERFAKWLLERESRTKEVEVDRTYRMLKLNTFLTAAVLALLGGEDSHDLIMTFIWFI